MLLKAKLELDKEKEEVKVARDRIVVEKGRQEKMLAEAQKRKHS
jgi:hypothetical protein